MGEPTTDTAPVSEGEVVAGKYRLGRVLGQGGMGVVVAAVHIQLNQRVALKFLRAEALGNPEVVARFTREAQAAARIQGVHVARVLDVGELPSGAPFMVMEYLEGQDLECVLRNRGPLPIAEAVDLLLQGCEAVAEAHSQGVVHRDLKPANLFLALYPGGRQIVKVLDFGISKLQGPPGNAGLTQAASMFGSPPYMAPEQVRSARAADVRSDIWSLGAMLYELLTQKTPFSTESVERLFAAILFEDPAPPRSLRADIPPGLDAAILRCLEKDPSNRFQDVASLAAALGPFGTASSADVPPRIAHILGTSATGVALSATAAAEGAAPALAPAPQAAFGGRPTLASPQTVQGIGATAATGSAAPQLPATAPVPVAANPSAIQIAASGRTRESRRLGVVITLAVTVAIATGGAAYWLGARSSRQAAGVPRIPPSPPAATGETPPSASSAAPPGPPAVGARPSLLYSSSQSARAASNTRHHASADGRPRERTTSAGGSVAAPAACADLLARLSLGEALTPEEVSTYAHACKKQ